MSVFTDILTTKKPTAIQNNILNVMRSRKKELEITKGRSETEPLYGIWKCPDCKEEEIEIKALQLTRSDTIRSISSTLKNNPTSLLSKAANCSCKTLFKEKYELVLAAFCLFNIQHEQDLQIYQIYSSSFSSPETKVLILKNRSVHFYTDEERLKLLGF